MSVNKTPAGKNIFLNNMGKLRFAKQADRYRSLIQTSRTRSEDDTGSLDGNPFITVQGLSCLDLSSNDYLGLAGHPRLINEAAAAMQKEGFGGRSSRLISGNNILYNQLETSLAEFKERSSALVFSSGYLANIGIITSHARRGDAIFCDQNVHASIIDACRLSGAKLHRFPHNDMDSLASMLDSLKSSYGNTVITEGLFSMDGDVGNIPAIMELADFHDAMVIVDDAHGTGTMGATGKGSAEHLGLGTEKKSNPRFIEIGTLSKAMGCLGGFALFSEIADTDHLGLKEYFVNFSRSLTYTTALPPAVLAGAIEAIRIIQDEPGLRDRLAENAHRMRAGLRSAGFSLIGDEISKNGSAPLLTPETSPIIPVLIGDDGSCVKFSKRAFELGVFVPGIRPPTVEHGKSRLRVSVTALLEAADIDKAIDILETVGKELSVIGKQ